MVCGTIGGKMPDNLNNSSEEIIKEFDRIKKEMIMILSRYTTHKMPAAPLNPVEFVGIYMNEVFNLGHNRGLRYEFEGRQYELTDDICCPNPGEVYLSFDGKPVRAQYHMCLAARLLRPVIEESNVSPNQPCRGRDLSFHIKALSYQCPVAKHPGAMGTRRIPPDRDMGSIEEVKCHDDIERERKSAMTEKENKLSDLYGLDPDFTNGKSVEQFLKDQRGDSDTAAAQKSFVCRDGDALRQAVEDSVAEQELTAEDVAREIRDKCLRRSDEDDPDLDIDKATALIREWREGLVKEGSKLEIENSDLRSRNEILEIRIKYLQRVRDAVIKDRQETERNLATVAKENVELKNLNDKLLESGEVLCQRHIALDQERDILKAMAERLRQDYRVALTTHGDCKECKKLLEQFDKDPNNQVE